LGLILQRLQQQSPSWLNSCILVFYLTNRK
jgi:hypothetical protein